MEVRWLNNGKLLGHFIKPFLKSKNYAAGNLPSKHVWTKPTKKSVFIPFYSDKPKSHVPVYNRHVICDNERRK